MEAIQSMLQGSGLFESQILVLLMIFGMVVLAVLGTTRFLFSGDAVGRRLRENGDKPAATGKTSAHSLKYKDAEGGLSKLLRPLTQYVIPTSEEGLSRIRATLMQAGYMGPSAVRIYYGLRVGLAITLPLLFSLFTPILSRQMPIEKIILLALGAALFGLYLPSLWVSQVRQKRQVAASNGFPDTLDMLLVCVEAGLSLDGALNRVGQEIETAHPVLAEQFMLVSLELRAGKSREEALRNLAHRIGIDDVRSFVTLLVQSENLGTSIALALRIHAEEMRRKRMSRAEEKANKLPVKLSVPLVLCILPALMLTVMSPAVITVIRNLLPALGGN